MINSRSGPRLRPGKVERLHQTLRRELLDGHQPFLHLAAAHAAVDTGRAEYNTTRPHQSLDMATPASRFTLAATASADGLELRLPAGLTSVPSADRADLVNEDPNSRSRRRWGWRWRSIGWCRRRGTWRCAGSSSGSAQTGPAP